MNYVKISRIEETKTTKATPGFLWMKLTTSFDGLVEEREKPKHCEKAREWTVLCSFPRKNCVALFSS